MNPTRANELLVLVVAGILSTAAFGEDDTTGGEQGTPYTVVCENTAEGRDCKVDRKTYVGWRTYHSFCYQCHAQDAVGSTFAPSLVDRLQRISRERFVDVVTHGYTGQVGVMPAWQDNPNVMPRLDQLYAYLKARSDGILPPGRPERMKEERQVSGTP